MVASQGLEPQQAESESAYKSHFTGVWLKIWDSWGITLANFTPFLV
jgi:hypothetical protein